MQCSVTLESDHNSGNVKMKTINNYKNPYKKESNLDNIVDQLCTRLQDIKDQEGASGVGMPTCSLEETDAVRRYYAAFPALKKGRESPLPYYLPPPAWCRKSVPDTKIKMQSELSVSKDWNSKNKKFSTGKERRNSYHCQRKNNKKRCNSYSRSFESKENLPEWVTHEGVWDMETQDPVKEFIRAIALDEGYGTCENTVTDEIKEITQRKIAMNENMVPDWDDGLDLDTEWVITEDLNPRVRTPMEEELYAKFEAKFDRSIEALWSKDQNTPDDEYQDLPIDFQDLLSSPSDRLFVDPSTEKCSLISLTESIWSTDATEFPPLESPALHDRFRPLNLAEVVEPQPREFESFALYEGDEIYDALTTVANTMRSFTVINHSRDRSGFVEVPPRRGRECPRAQPQPEPTRQAPSHPREDLLTSSRTHFRPIRRESNMSPRYADGDTFDIYSDPDSVEFQRSDSGGLFLGCTRYLEYRATRCIDYGRLNLTAAQRCPDLDEMGLRLRFQLLQCDESTQTEVNLECCAAKRMRASIWSPSPVAELSCDWEQMSRDINTPQYAVDMKAQYAGGKNTAQNAVGVNTALNVVEVNTAHNAVGVNTAQCASDMNIAQNAGDTNTAQDAGVIKTAKHASDLNTSLTTPQYAGDINGLYADDINAQYGDGDSDSPQYASDINTPQYAGDLNTPQYAGDRKRRHSATKHCVAYCGHPHARFLPCCSTMDRPLTR